MPLLDHPQTSRLLAALPHNVSVSDVVEEQLARLRGALEHGWVCGECEDPTCPPGTRRQWANGMREDDYEFSLEDFEDQRCVVLEFSAHESPGVRYRHRFPPPPAEGPDYSDVYFMEDVEAGKLARSRARGSSDSTVVWTDFSWRHQRMRWLEAWDLLREGRLREAEALLRRADADSWDRSTADDIARTAAEGPDTPALHRLHEAFQRHLAEVRAADAELMQR
ncbi:MAG: hypothetical protein JWP11_922 [Frankiales bacterium]|nr:hypothetical protein [Frankiales bacterium]